MAPFQAKPRPGDSSCLVIGGFPFRNRYPEEVLRQSEQTSAVGDAVGDAGFNRRRNLERREVVRLLDNRRPVDARSAYPTGKIKTAHAKAQSGVVGDALLPVGFTDIGRLFYDIAVLIGEIVKELSGLLVALDYC